MKINFNGNPSILKNFLYYLISTKGYSIHTIKNYQLDLMLFFKFIREYLHINSSIKNFTVFILGNIDEHTITAFLVYLNYYRNNSASTRQRRLSSIRSFYKWLFKNYPPFSDKENPTKYIPNVEPVVRIPKHLNVEQAKRIQTIFTLKNTKFPQRNNLIITLFLHTGLRISELIGININDISFSDNSILIRGKNHKERKVYLNKYVSIKLKDYLNTRNKKNKILKLNEPLFISYQNKRIGVDGVEDICKKAFFLLGLKDYGYTAHTLRHTAATIIYNYTHDLILLKNFLNHANISTTEIYTHVNNEQLRQAVNKNPLNIIVSPKTKVA